LLMENTSTISRGRKFGLKWVVSTKRGSVSTKMKEYIFRRNKKKNSDGQGEWRKRGEAIAPKRKGGIVFSGGRTATADTSRVAMEGEGQAGKEQCREKKK